MIHAHEIIFFGCCPNYINNLKNHPSSFILNVSSLASFTPMPYKCMYAASKSFVYSFTRALRSELKHTSVSVSVLCPGAVPTNELKRKNIQSHGIIAKLSSMNPEEIAEIAIAATLNKQQVIVPGICNKLSMYIMKVIPQSLQLQLLNFGYAKLNSSI